MPLHLQLKHHIEHFIRTGRLLPGTRLEPERTLAERLRVSRNTVSLAYRSLEKEGWLRSRQGQGTFVEDFAVGGRLDGAERRLQQLIELGFQEALAFGYSPQDFLAMVRRKVEGETQVASTVRVAMVECNREQLDYFSGELKLGPGVIVFPVLLSDMMRVPDHAQEVLGSADLVVTTFFHLDDVARCLPKTTTVLGIALDPLVETMVQMARLPSRTRVGLVCLSEAFAQRVCKSLVAAGISELEVETTTTRSPHELHEFVRRQSVIIVSPGRKREVTKEGQQDQEVIEFMYRPDAGSINTLKAAVRETRTKLLQRSDHHVAGSQDL